MNMLYTVRHGVVRYWFWMVRLMFLGGGTSLFTFRSCCSSNRNGYSVSSANDGYNVEKLINTDFEDNICQKKILHIDCGIVDQRFEDKCIYADPDIAESVKEIANKKIGLLCRMQMCVSDCTLNFDFSTTTSSAKLIAKRLTCEKYLKCKTLKHSFFGIYTYNSTKESNKYKLIKVISDDENNNCKMIEELNKILWREKLWKKVKIFVGLCFFAFIVGILLWLFNSGDKVHKNKSITGDIRAVNISDYGERRRRRRKNEVRKKNRSRNRIKKNKSIKKMARRNRGRFARKRV